MPYGYYGYYGYGDGGYSLYLILMLVVLVFSLLAQASVQTTFGKYNKVRNRRGLTGYDAAKLILTRNGLSDVRIERISGNLTDHYDPKTNVVRLSESVYDSPSIAAVGVAAHECGHAVQHAVGYTPIKIRSAIVPVTQFASKWAMVIFFAGFLFSYGILAEIGFWLYAVIAFFQFVTLPVEFNASRRALLVLEENSSLDREELSGAKKVLSAAAMTYVAALASALVQLLRLWMMMNRRNNRRR